MRGSIRTASLIGRRGRVLAAAASGLALSLICAVTAITPSATAAAACGTANVAQNQPATASSVEASRLSAANAVDGNATHPLV